MYDIVCASIACLTPDDLLTVGPPPPRSKTPKTELLFGSEGDKAYDDGPMDPERLTPHFLIYSKKTILSYEE